MCRKQFWIEKSLSLIHPLNVIITSQIEPNKLFFSPTEFSRARKQSKNCLENIIYGNDIAA